MKATLEFDTAADEFHVDLADGTELVRLPAPHTVHKKLVCQTVADCVNDGRITIVHDSVDMSRAPAFVVEAILSNPGCMFGMAKFLENCQPSILPTMSTSPTPRRNPWDDRGWHPDQDGTRLKTSNAP